MADKNATAEKPVQGNESGNKDVVEIPEKNESRKEPQVFNMEDVKDWSKEEIEMAKEHGLLNESKEPTPEEGKDTPKDGTESKPKSQPEPVKEERRKESSGEDWTLTPEQEKILAEKFDKDPDLPSKLKNVSAQYWGRKQAIGRAQAAEADRDRFIKENTELKERLGKLEAKLETPPPESEEEDDRPMTKKEFLNMIQTMRKDEEDARRKISEQTTKERQKRDEALQIQENHAKSNYPDYEKMVGLGIKLVERDETGKFVHPINITNIPEGARKRAVLLLRQIASAQSRAHEMTISDFTIPEMSYEIGRIASEYMQESEPSGQEPNANSGHAERNDGGLTPEDEERIRKNKSRSGSSASVSGSGGRRVVSVDDVTIDDLNSMDTQTFDAFQGKYPQKVDELMRG